MHTVTRACPKGDSLLSICAETTSTILVSGDSAGRLKVWHLVRVKGDGQGQGQGQGQG